MLFIIHHPVWFEKDVVGFWGMCYTDTKKRADE